MTYGAKTIDNRFPVWDELNARFQSIGEFTNRIWAGTDSPRLSRNRLRREFSAYHSWFVNPLTGLVSSVPMPGYKSYGRKSRKFTSSDARVAFSENEYNATIRHSMTPTATLSRVSYENDPPFPPIETTMAGTGLKNLPSASDVFTANDELELLNKLSELVSGPDFNLAVSVAESGEAFQMIRKTISDVAAAVHFARKGNMRAAAVVLGVVPLARHRANLKPIRKNAVKQLSERWLELQYGWLPLLSDVKAAGESLAFHSENRPLTRKTRASVTRRMNVEPDVPGNLHYVTVRKSITLKYTEAQAPAMHESLGLTDPLSVAWEKLPYSFVVDWFLPVGDYLQARSFVANLTGGIAILSTKVTTYQSVSTVRGGPAEKPVSFLKAHGLNAYTVTTYSRNVVPASSLAAPPPGLKNPVGVKHAANAAALLAPLLGLTK